MFVIGPLLDIKRAGREGTGVGTQTIDVTMVECSEIFITILKTQIRLKFKIQSKLNRYAILQTAELIVYDKFKTVEQTLWVFFHLQQGISFLNICTEIGK